MADILTPVGVYYCIIHHGIANEDEIGPVGRGVCDFFEPEYDQRECILHQLHLKGVALDSK